MCTSGPRPESLKFFPTVGFPRERFVVARELAAVWGRNSVGRCIRAVWRSNPPEQSGPLPVRQRRHKWHYVVGGQ